MFYLRQAIHLAKIIVIDLMFVKHFIVCKAYRVLGTFLDSGDSRVSKVVKNPCLRGVYPTSVSAGSERMTKICGYWRWYVLWGKMERRGVGGNGWLLFEISLVTD